MTMQDIPLLDISAWREGTSGQRRFLAARMDEALQQSGFLMVGNHGVPAGLREEIRAEAPDGTWADAPYVADAFTVNVADLMSRWTGKRWRSTRHRVLPPSREAPDEELISLIVFLQAEVDTVIRPVAGDMDFEPVVAGEWLRAREAAATVS